MAVRLVLLLLPCGQERLVRLAPNTPEYWVPRPVPLTVAFERASDPSTIPLADRYAPSGGARMMAFPRGRARVELWTIDGMPIPEDCFSGPKNRP